ncbi:phospholipase D-like domain-containing protein [Metapseudomonas furukawaii]
MQQTRRHLRHGEGRGPGTEHRTERHVTHRDHRKLLIVDGQLAFLGGINISSVCSGGSFSVRSKVRPGGELPWRDTDLRVEGPVVAELQKLFISLSSAQPLSCVDATMS